MTRRAVGTWPLTLAPLVVLAVGCSLQPAGSSLHVTAPPVASGAHAGGTLRVAVTRPTAVDPALVSGNDTAANLVVHTMCDPLIGVDPATRRLVPAVVSSWRILQEGSQLQLTLSHGARFSDGSKVTVSDVLRTLQRVIDPNTAAPQADVFAHVVGFQDVRDGKTRPRAIPGLTQSTSDTFTIGLDRNDSEFLYALTTTVATPVKAAATGTRGFAQQPVCVGPYRLAAPYTGREPTLTLERSAAYAGTQPALAGSGRGFADRITFDVVPTKDAALAALRKGTADVAAIPNDAVGALARAGLQPLRATTGVMEYVGLPSSAPFDNRLLRIALSLAVDRAGIARDVYQGGRVPATGFIPPTLPAAVTPDVAECKQALPVASNAALARRAIQAAHVSLQGKHFPFYFNDEFHNKALVDAVTKAWAAVGVTMVPTPVSFDALLTRGASATGFDGAFRMAAVADYPDAYTFLSQLIDQGAIGTTNLTFFAEPGLERQLDRKVGKAIDDEQLKTALSTAELEACGLLPVIPVAWGEAVYAAGRRVLVAAHDGMDHSAALPELRELAVR
jgi:oligopeptide transport system substrate-binding protein